MNREFISTAHVLDIIFDGRNKAYGAYNLRKTYNLRIGYSLLGTAAVCLLLYFNTLYKSGANKVIPQMFVDPEITISDNLPDVNKPLPTPLAPKPQSVQVKTVQFIIPRIIEDKQVIDPPPTTEQITNTTIDSHTVDGVNGDGTVAPPAVNSNGTGVDVAPKVKGDDSGGFVGVQIEAEFPSGKDAWKRFLERNLNNELPSDEGAPVGLYTVVVSFMVDKEGRVSEVVAENDPQYGTAKEAVRVIKKGPVWKPAIQNGHPVAYRVKQSITFVVN